MSVQASSRDVKARFEDYLTKVVEEGEPCVVQREGKNYAVLVSHDEWERREFGRHLDGMGDEYRVPPEIQRRAAELLTAQGQRRLNADERREVQQLRKVFDRVMLRRSQAMEQLR